MTTPIDGYKTYLVCLAAVLYGALHYLAGDMTLDEAMNFILDGGMVAALRHGVSGLLEVLKLRVSP